MTIEDLGLVFEFEDEGENEKADIIDVGEDLNFIAVSKNRDKAQLSSIQKLKDQDESKVRSIKDHLALAEKKGDSAHFSDDEEATYVTNELSSLKYEIENLKSQMREAKKTSDVEIAIAEAKNEYLIKYITDAKLMDFQVNQILSRIHKKVPALKNEALTIKKIILDFLNKSQK